MAIRCLTSSTSPLSRSTLLELVTDGTTLFGKTKMAPKSSLMLEALRVLTAQWDNRAEAAEVLKLARGSKDPDVRGAAGAAPTN